MGYENYIRLLIFAASITLGALLAAVRAKVSSSNGKTVLSYLFYFVSILAILSCVIGFFFYYNSLNLFGVIVIVVTILSSMGLFAITYVFLPGKNHYTIAELNPIVNDFTKNADTRNIRLLAGDINFFGQTPNDMDGHSQYICLRTKGFQKIEILCLEPLTNTEKIRYGKMLCDFNQVEFRYYQPTQADLQIRGRMKTHNNVTKLLIYKKVTPGVYEAIESDTSDTTWALYDHIWNLIWTLARRPTAQQIAEYKDLYRN